MFFDQPVQVRNRDFLARWSKNDKAALLSYSDADTYRDAGQGGFEIRTFIAIAGLAPEASGEIWHYDAIPPSRSAAPSA